MAVLSVPSSAPSQPSARSCQAATEQPAANRTATGTRNSLALCFRYRRRFQIRRHLYHAGASKWPHAETMRRRKTKDAVMQKPGKPRENWLLRPIANRPAAVRQAKTAIVDMMESDSGPKKK